MIFPAGSESYRVLSRTRGQGSQRWKNSGIVSLRIVRRALASSLLSLLLVTTVIWGGCISCEQYFMFQGTKDCCNPDGHCRNKAPSKNSAGRECSQIAFDYQKTIHLHIDLPAVALLRVELPLPAVPAIPPWRDLVPVDPSPPNLQILHSTFLI